MVLGFGKKRRPPSFKDRVTEFWDWYPRVADRFFEAMEQGRCEDLTSEVVEFMERTLPTLSWVFGPAEDGGHSFTLTGEGLVPKQLLAEYWLSRAPEIPHWTFHGSRQPAPAESLKDIAIQVGGEEQVDAGTFQLATSVDDEEKVIDIVAWHPALKQVPAEHHYQILFLLLDEALGEFGTQTWLGEIKVEPLPAGERSMTLCQLPEFIQQVSSYHQWEKLAPLQSFSLYQVQSASDSRRGDTVVGTTCIPNVIFEFLEHDGILPEDPLEETGAELVYVAIDSTVFPDGQQSDVRGNIEDALGTALMSQQSGRTLGGAFGTAESYIDLILFDGANSRAIVESVLVELQLAGRSRLESFR